MENRIIEKKSLSTFMKKKKMRLKYICLLRFVIHDVW